MASASALQIVPSSGEVDASDARTRARVPVAHLSSEKIAEALKASSGVMAEAARRLRISRDTLYERARVDPVVEAARNEAREVFLDLGESELAKLVKAGNPVLMQTMPRAPADPSDGDTSGARSQLPTRSTRSRRSPLPTRSIRPQRLIYGLRCVLPAANARGAAWLARGRDHRARGGTASPHRHDRCAQGVDA